MWKVLSFLSATQVAVSKGVFGHGLRRFGGQGSLFLGVLKSGRLGSVSVPKRGFRSSVQVFSADEDSVDGKVFVKEGLEKTTPSETISAPKIERIPENRSMHGKEWVDSYRWIIEADEKKIESILSAEKNFIQRKLAEKLKNKVDMLSEEMNLIAQTQNDGIPEIVDDIEFSHKIDPNTESPIYYWKKGNEEPKVLLDIPKLAREYGYVSTQVMKISPDYKKLAFTMDIHQNEQHDLYIRDLTSGKITPITTNDNVLNVEWLTETELAYTQIDSKHRANKVIVTTPFSKHTKVEYFEERDPSFFVDIRATKDKKFILITSSSKSTTEVRLIDPTRLSEPPILAQERQTGLEYFLDHGKQGFFIATNIGDVKDFAIYTAHDSNLKDWKPLLPHRPGVCVTDMELFENHLILFETRKGDPGLTAVDLETRKFTEIALPGFVGSITKGINLGYKSKTFRFSTSSLIEPEVVYDYELQTGNLRTLQKTPIEGDFNSDDYAIYRLMFPSHDGVLIPLTLCHKKKLPLNRRNPTVIEAYGAYGSNIDTNFDVAKIPLLKRGWIFAFPHIRGGGEFGREWYESGRLRNKKNSILDVVSCADFLIGQGYSSPRFVALTGMSAGGVSTATAVNMQPDLFGALLLRSPFVDMLEATSNTEHSLAELEHEEWGNPLNSEADFDNIRSVCPYESIKPQEYPPILVRSSLVDFRTPLWQHLRFIAKLRENDANGGSRIYLRCLDGAGHYGETRYEDRIREAAIEYAFLADSFGLDDEMKPIPVKGN